MRRILLIDDEESVLKMLKTFFERQGFDVEVATDGGIGLAINLKSRVDIVVTDILMPHKEGFETIREFRLEFPDVKIIAISGGGRNGADTYLEFAKSFGADKTFAKPFDLSELRDAVDELLGLEKVS
ncbi:MAG: response regulator [Candidatus Hydrogenedentes bacterium]|nr:response regulator [Candidatus Hydrogenedentota bacterium]